MIAIAVLASLALVGWLIFRLVRGKQVRAYMVTYAVAVATGIFTYAFFLSMQIPQLIKVLVSIILGVILIIAAAYFQRHRQVSRPK